MAKADAKSTVQALDQNFCRYRAYNMMVHFSSQNDWDSIIHCAHLVDRLIFYFLTLEIRTVANT
eukprot:scaffold7849_cov23-Prasinocladus_malaysianus.AAC.2